MRGLHCLKECTFVKPVAPIQIIVRCSRQPGNSTSHSAGAQNKIPVEKNVSVPTVYGFTSAL